MARTTNSDHPAALGMPTKRLFIETLVRDIDLAASVVDLIDNSVDGAKRTRPSEKFRGLWINILINGDRFEVSDNCGGIDLSIAEKYAFRFGRDDDYQGEVKHSVGHFGVGMKRTLFKVAQKFLVESTTSTTKFRLELDVAKWQKNKEKWNFPLTDVVRKARKPLADVGTRIVVEELRPEVAEQFAMTNFVNEISERIRLAHSDAIARGLKITFNGIVLEREHFYLKVAKSLKPMVRNGGLTAGKSQGVVTWRLLAGVDERSSTDSGWYVFCNNRLLLKADQSENTGWGEKPAPKFHQQFNYFRGYLYLDSKDAGLLPWNTTKTGLSEDSDVYGRMKLEMREATKTVTTFLNALREEEVANELTGEGTPLLDVVKAAHRKDVSDEEAFKACREQFVFPSKAGSKQVADRERRITYKVPVAQFNAVKKALEVTTQEEVGLATFEYFFDNEVDG